MRRLLGFAASALLAAALGGCAALPSGVDRPVSSALAPTPEAPLVRIAAASLPADAGANVSAFRLLADPDEALQARLALVRRAVASVDIQSYLIANDRTGDEFRAELAAAAGRGVRIRVLVDDLFATGQDALWRAFAARRGVEVRLFNPLPVRGGGFVRRVALSLHELPRINQRMHNKLFVVDGAFAVIGGRNIADAYFGRSDAATDFVDLDLVGAGAVVAELAAAFDAYWNSAAAYPVEALVPALPAGDARSDAASPATAPSGAFVDGLDAGRVELVAASARVFVDSPAKIGRQGRGEVSAAWLELLGGARREALIASPYVVPDDDTMAAFDGTATRDVSVMLLTNSIGTTDEPLVHLAYSRKRDRLLDARIALHEMMPARSPEAKSAAASERRGSLGRLHAKVAVLDDRRLFIGSMNLDHRSALCNTEVALVVDSEALAAEAKRVIGGWRDGGTWRLVRERAQAPLGWAERRAEGDRVSRNEPNVGAVLTFGRRLMGMLVADSML